MTAIMGFKQAVHEFIHDGDTVAVEGFTHLTPTQPGMRSRIKFIERPFTGERLAAVPALRPDVAVIHAQQADRRGNVLMWGIG